MEMATVHFRCWYPGCGIGTPRGLARWLQVQFAFYYFTYATAAWG